MPRRLLGDLLDQGLPLSALDDRRLPLVQAEFLGSLLTARQVVINRTYLYRNPVISADYSQDGANRRAFEQLIAKRAIVPFLLYERSPVAAADASDEHFVDEATAWNNICRNQEDLYESGCPGTTTRTSGFYDRAATFRTLRPGRPARKGT